MLLSNFQGVLAALSELPRGQKYFYIFWLSGPFILLIERTPADVWLSVCAIGFLVNSFHTKDFTWLRFFWVKATLSFWGFCLFSSAVSSLPVHSMVEAFIWIRFPLFAMATCFWLAKDRRLLYAMLVSTFLGMIVIGFILLAELIIVGQQGGRLSWPYGDLVPGNYLTKVGMPALLMLTATAVSSKSFNLMLGSSLCAVFALVMSIFAGERTNFLLSFCSGLLATISCKPEIRKLVTAIIVATSSIVAILILVPASGNRFVKYFINELPFNEDSPYARVWQSGLEAFYTSPLVGLGPNNYRIFCATINAQNQNVDCHTHPHNFYIQMLAETGLIGLCLGVVMICSLIWYCWKSRSRSEKNVIVLTAYIIPLGMFFPIQSTADFFGQWNNIFMWSAIALALSARNIRE